MRVVRQQSGITLIGGLIILIVIGFVGYVTMKLVPVYLEYFNVLSSVKSLQEDPDLHNKSEEEVRDLLKRRFFVNDVRSVKSKDAKIKKADTRTTVTVNYEVRTPIIGNLDTVVSFNIRQEFKN